MAYAAASGFPPRFFPGLIAGTGSVTGSSGVFIPFSALESYGTANSGEVSELVYSIVDKFSTGINALPTDDLPNKFSVSRTTTLTGDTTATKAFSLNFDMNVTSAVYDVQSES